MSYIDFVLYLAFAVVSFLFGWLNMEFWLIGFKPHLKDMFVVYTFAMFAITGLSVIGCIITWKWQGLNGFLSEKR